MMTPTDAPKSDASSTAPVQDATTAPHTAAETLAAAKTAASHSATRTLATARKLGNPWLLAALLIAGLSTWQWVNTRQQLQNSQQTFDKRLSDADSSNKEIRQQAKQSQEQVAALQSRLASLESRLDEYADQAGGLQAVYRDLAINRDVAVLTEIEHALTLATQQLQATGHFSSAISTLQASDTRLARLDRPHFEAVRKALAHDLERLRNTPTIDLLGMNLRLENLLVSVDRLPFAMDARPSSAPLASASNADTSWWKNFSNGLWQEIRSLIRIERLDAATPVLLPVEQQFFVRENIKLRLLSARLSLQARDQVSFGHEIVAAQTLLEQHFSPEDKGVQNALAGLRQFAGTQLNTELPTLQESISAIRQALQTTEKKAKP